jgi:opacity protein-like surface antigen
MNLFRRSFFSLVLLLLPGVVMAAFPAGSTGIAVPAAQGIAIDGARLGDVDYDLSKPRGGELPLTGRLSCSVVSQSTDLDDKGSRFSALTLMLESKSVERTDEDFPFISTCVSAGMSYASMVVAVFGRDADDATWILQFGAGMEIRMSSAVTFDLRYRYLKPFERTLWLDGVPESIGIDTHNFLVGMRIGF